MANKKELSNKTIVKNINGGVLTTKTTPDGKGSLTQFEKNTKNSSVKAIKATYENSDPKNGTYVKSSSFSYSSSSKKTSK
ncbi:MAG: hypothetical protein LBD05_00710 [Mycoplasmataceae bacterium]|jgi:regulatory protein YycI of two-component signal transduction system YycFG|nr:hypothetical protein [Mycoplasmataceae bacterium]